MVLRRALIVGLTAALAVLAAGCGPDEPAGPDLSDFASALG